MLALRRRQPACWVKKLKKGRLMKPNGGKRQLPRKVLLLQLTEKLMHAGICCYCSCFRCLIHLDNHSVHDCSLMHICMAAVLSMEDIPWPTNHMAITCTARSVPLAAFVHTSGINFESSFTQPISVAVAMCQIVHYGVKLQCDCGDYAAMIFALLVAVCMRGRSAA